ncbi:hypothetical protein Ciccas_002840 [Cichlidogyrus casuarinus]|uniref:SH3 domain-containing protein n=1 Tax=Cichlidogyrus casuarinus TaxID=1844966 RepID=A0ABD2QG25_9PLAT
MVMSRSWEVGRLLQMQSDYQPPQDWQVQYRVLCVRKGDFVQLERQPPLTPKDEAAGASSWLMVRKWCPNHRNSTGHAGFVPRHLCRQVAADSSTYAVYNTPGEPVRNQHNYCSKIAQTSTGPPSTNSQDTNHGCVFGSGASLTYGSEHEDRDSGRGPSSGSEWSSAGCKTSRDSEELEQLQSRWNDPDSEAWLAESQSVTDSPPLLPPPMEPLKDPLGDRFATSTSEVLPSPPYWVDQRWTMTKREKSTNNEQYEPYKTMIQLSENALEKLTLV